MRGMANLWHTCLATAVAQVLLRVPEARVIAVEPSASNLFYLTSSLVALGRAAPGGRPFGPP